AGLTSFFFSSRRRHTRFSRDWSSDVCSSDLGADGLTQTVTGRNLGAHAAPWGAGPHPYLVAHPSTGSGIATDSGIATGTGTGPRSEERRVGKESAPRSWPRTAASEHSGARLP